jgi:hypothetical protein
VTDLPPPGGYLPPPGGYPPPPPAPGWWQASDGQWYPPHQHPSYAAAYAPGYAPGYPVQQVGTNGLAIASMVLGILWLWWIGSVLAVVFGHIALGQIKRTGQGGRGMAIAGLVLGYLGIALLVVTIAVVAANPDVSSFDGR